MSQTLTVASTLQCPHGGTVSITPSNQRVTAAKAFIATASDLCSITGCTFQLPTTPPTPSPCVTVEWQTHDLQVSAGSATLSEASHGFCVSAMGATQGAVIIGSTQTNVRSQ